jgi:hypothetical protein
LIKEVVEMGLLGKLIKTTINVATLPVSIVADVVTMGGAVNERDEPYTISHVKCVAGSIVEVLEEAEKL